MPELRKDLLTDNWVIIAEDRRGRPHYSREAEGWEHSPENCPFEPGHEGMTPPEIDAIPGNEQSDSWRVRVVPNKYNAMDPDLTLEDSSRGLFRRMNAVGEHEVVIETPEHYRKLKDFSPNQFMSVLKIFGRRLENLYQQQRVRYVQIFRNEGRKAGATLLHPHSQIVTFPFIPSRIKTRLLTSYKHYRSKNECIFCSMIDQETREESRVIENSNHFLVLAPYASRYPYETWILPKRHSHRARHMKSKEVRDLANLLPRTLSRIHNVRPNPPHNILFFTSPKPRNDTGNSEYLRTVENHYHWHLELIPRLKRIAGLELATETYINTVSPETASERLRNLN